MSFNFILMIFSDSFSEIMKTGENTASSQKVHEKELRSNFSDEQLNYFKFAQIVTTEFPRALRQTFRAMWDNKFGNMTGFKPWDDSPDVRKLFLKAESGKTGVPTHLSYEEWDFFALIQATIHARSFTGPDSKGQRRKLPQCKFHASVVSPVGYDLESSLHAIHQIRLLRNLFCHSLKAEIDKETFDHYVQQAKEAFIALGIATDEIDAIASTASGWFPRVPCEVEGGIRQEIFADVKRLGGGKRKLKPKIDDLEQEHDKRSKATTCVCFSFCFFVCKKQAFPRIVKPLYVNGYKPSDCISSHMYRLKTFFNGGENLFHFSHITFKKGNLEINYLLLIRLKII